MDKFTAVRKMYNDAGVTIYAYRPGSTWDAEIAKCLKYAKDALA